jgi:hypothetical protein
MKQGHELKEIAAAAHVTEPRLTTPGESRHRALRDGLYRKPFGSAARAKSICACPVLTEILPIAPENGLHGR